MKINRVEIDGLVGRIKEGAGGSVSVAICHKKSFFDKKKDEWRSSDLWFYPTFFGKKAIELKERATVGAVILILGELSIYQKGAVSMVTINGHDFFIIEKKQARVSGERQDDLSAIVEDDPTIPF